MSECIGLCKVIGRQVVRSSVPIYTNGNMVCKSCMTADTIIMGDNKTISSISIGDGAIGVSGLGRVEETFVHEYSGKLLRLHGEGLLPINTTPEHPFLVVHSHTQPHQHKISFTKPYWLEANKLKEKHSVSDGHYLLVPKVKGSQRNEAMSLASFSSIHGLKVITGMGYPTKIPINEDTAWLMGLYVAEGCAIQTHGKPFSFQFALNKNETVLLDRIRKITTALGYRSRQKTSKSEAVSVILYSRLLARAFKEWFGDGAPNKRIPDFILFHENPSIPESFLQGYMEGDGCIMFDKRYNQQFYTASTVSKILIQQVQLLLARFGILGNITTTQKQEDGVILGRKVKLHTRYRFTFKTTFRHPFKVALGEDYIATPLRKIEEIPFQGKVYNIRTSDNTYLVSNAIVHNCNSVFAPRKRLDKEKINQFIKTNRSELFNIVMDLTTGPTVNVLENTITMIHERFRHARCACCSASLCWRPSYRPRVVGLESLMRT